MMISTEAPGRSRHRRKGSPSEVLVIVSAGVVLASLDLFIVNVALPQIARDLHSHDLGQLSWILNAYAIVYASLLVFFGRLADRFRRDRAFLLGVAVFTAASAACAASANVAMLIGFRVVQAAGAALLTPTSLGLVLASFSDPQQRSRAVRTWTAVGGLAAAVGPVVGGLLVAVNWRLVFLVNLPIGLAAFLVGWRRLPEIPGHANTRPGPFGVVLVTSGVGLLTFGLVKGSVWGWSSARIDVILATAGGLLGLFALHCVYGRSPLVQPDLFRSRQFTGASLIALFFSASFGAMLLSIVLWEQGTWGWSALRAGLAIAPGPLMVPVTSFLVAGRLIRRYGSAAVISLGCLTFATGLVWWAQAVAVSPDYLSGVVGGMILTGVGVGLTLPTMMAAAAASLPPHAFATGSAVVNMIRQTGLALGVAVLIAVLGTGATQHRSTLASFQHAWWLAAAVSAVGIIPAIGLLRPPRAIPVGVVAPT